MSWWMDDEVFCDQLFMIVNTLRSRQDGSHFADDIFTCIFFNENCCILIKFSLKYVRKGPIDNNSALVQIMAWRRSGDKPLSEPMTISLPTHICLTRPPWVNLCLVEFGWGNIDMYLFFYLFSTRKFWIFLKSSFMKAKDPFILHSQNHGCWWPGHARSQGISTMVLTLFCGNI